MVYQVANILLTKNGRFKTPMLRSGLCDYRDDCIVVNEEIADSCDYSNRTCFLF